MQGVRSDYRLARAVRDVLRTASARKDALRGLAIAACVASTALPVQAADLPAPCVAGSCGGRVFVETGTAGATIVGNTLTVNQATHNATLNWAQFNISADGVVNFQQPSTTATALNRIWDNDPSRIFGALNANGRIYLLNRNGLLFGSGAKVNVAALVASSLDLNRTLEEGIADAAARNGEAAFTPFADTLFSGHVVVERGASITTPSGGQVFMFAPKVVNEGTIRTPDGQTILAAGNSVYLLANDDTNLRGLLVEVGVEGGEVTNGVAANANVTRPEDLVGQIIAERGNVTLAGLAVNQQGRVSATTSVQANGSIRLQARDGGSAIVSGTEATGLVATHGGTLVLGQGSRTEVLLDTKDTQAAVDVTERAVSQVLLSGHQVHMLDRSSIIAPAGQVSVTAQVNPSEVLSSTTASDSRIYFAADSLIDVTGAHVERSMESNVIEVELRGNELRDSPLQRDGALRGQRVRVDVREHGVRDDGTTWEGTPLADVAGNIATMERSVQERNLTGGEVTLASQGDVILAATSAIDVSGGSIQYRDGYINTSQLLSNGRVVDIGAANRDGQYQGIARTTVSVAHPRWGVTETFTGFIANNPGRFEAGYIEGKDAGTVNITGRNLVLDGNMRGDVAVGRHQRLPGTDFDSSSRLYRPHDQVPIRGLLQIGNAPSVAGVPDYRTPNVRFEEASLLPLLLNENGRAFDPLTDLFPSEQLETYLRPSLMGDDGMGSIQIFSNGRITVPSGVELRGSEGAELRLTAGEIDFGGRFASFGGTAVFAVSPTVVTPAESVSMLLSAGSSIYVRGRWVNDDVALGGPAVGGARFIDGGTVNLSVASGEMVLAEGALIDASAGAWRRQGGQVSGGDGGTISIASRSQAGLPESPITLAAQLRAYGFDEGGALSLAANAVCIADEDCTNGSGSTLWLTPDFFAGGGFESYTVSSNRGDLRVHEGSIIRPQLPTLEFTGDPRRLASGSDLSAFVQATVLPDFLRRPTNLALRTSISGTPVGGDFLPSDFDQAGILDVQRGALFDLEPRASLSLTSSTRLLFDGVALVPAGNISLTLDRSLRQPELLPAQGIWLGANARLAAPGAVRIEPSQLGRREGEVLSGGTVSITATQGYVAINPGAVIDVSGAAADLDIRTSIAGPFESRRIASDGGSISVYAAEGALLSGSLRAHAGDGPGAVGGAFSLEVNAQERNETEFPIAQAAARTVRVTQDRTPIGIAPGTALPDFLNGLGTISVEQIDEGGFGSVALAARNLTLGVGSAAQVRSYGAIEFAGAVDLSLSQRLVLDAPSILADNPNVRLAASYVALGSTDDRSQATPLASVGAGHLNVSGDFVDLIGAVSLQGIERVGIASRGDLRLRGIQVAGGTELLGAFAAAGQVELTADQIYPSTLTRFTIAANGSPDAAVTIRSNGEPRGDVLSAAGALRIEAPTIVNEGALRAPFGEISLIGDAVTLAAGSVTSTSADGLTIPFGRTQGGFDWVYQLAENRTTLYGVDETAVPQQRVVVDGDNVSLESGAVIDVSGGGDFVASEFVPGVGGSRDLLSASERPDTYVIVPTRSLAFAPHDTLEYEGSNLRAGDSIYLSGVEGVPEGTYALLPARYALLPGAYLVTALDGYRDLPSGESIGRPDGSTVVAGYRLFAGSAAGPRRTEGFAVRPASDILREARYTATSANDFFARQAADADAAAPRLPRDSGVLSIAASATLRLDSALRATAGTNGRGAAVDIASEFLRIVPGESDSTDAFVNVSADSLSRLGAESLFLGGSRVATDDGTRLNVSSAEVEIDAGAQLSVAEVMIAARDRVTLEEGATVEARGTRRTGESETLLLEGDGALLRASIGPQVRIARTNGSGTTGVLEIQAGATVAASRAVALDASTDVRSQGAIDVAGGSLNLGASRISLGDAGEVTEGLVLDAAALTQLNLAELVLTSRSSVDVHGSAALGVANLVVDAGGISGFGEGVARLQAREQVELRNTAAVELSSSGTGTASLEIAADVITLSEGEFHLSGFSGVELRAGGAIVADGAQVESAAPLTLVTPLLTSATGATSTIESVGQMAIRSASATSTTAEHESYIGGRLTLAGEGITHQGRIDLASGVLEMHAHGAGSAGGILLGSGSVVNLAGETSSFDGVSVGTPGGRVTLLADGGDVRQDAGAVVDVSGAGEADAGRVSITARNGAAAMAGELRGRASTNAASGTFEVEAEQIADLSALNRSLNAGEFAAARRFHQRGAGDLIVAADSDAAIRAHEVSLIADQGSVSVLGTIIASGASGGRVELAALNDVEVRGTIDASATADQGNGGRVSLMSTQAGVRVAAGSRVDVTAGADADRAGRLDVRMARTSLATLLDTDLTNNGLVLSGDIVGAGRIQLEGFQSYQVAGNTIGAAEVAADPSNVIFADAETFMQGAATIRDALDREADASFTILPGVEIVSDGDLTLSANWNLHDWRFGGTDVPGAPGVLTLRAAGNLLLNASISDAFFEAPPTNTNPNAATVYALSQEPEQSWSYRLAAGADQSAAHPLSVRPLNELAEGSGSVRLVAGTQGVGTAPARQRTIRTGTGSIEIAAGRDLSLGNRFSTIYTAGTASGGTTLAGLTNRAYPSGGGDVSIAVGGDINGAQSNQLVTDWLWRVGRPETTGNVSATGWTVNFGRFEQNVAALGGGNVSVRAGGDVKNLSVSIPTIGRQDGGTTPETSRVSILAGGNLDVEAGGAIVAGSFYVGEGAGRIDADALAPTTVSGLSLFPILALGDGRFDIATRGDLGVGAVTNPTMLRFGRSQTPGTAGYFSTYSDSSALSLLSMAGQVVLDNNPSPLSNSIAGTSGSIAATPSEMLAFFLYPSLVRSVAYSGDVAVNGNMALWPSAAGNLELLAAQNVYFGDGVSDNSVQVLLSDADVDLLPSVARPSGAFTPVFNALNPANALLASSLTFHAEVPVHDNGGRPVENPVRVVARDGEIAFRTSNQNPSFLAVAKPARLLAGGDIVDLGFLGQNLSELDVTSIVAGDDITYSNARGANNELVSNVRQITLDGPGALQLAAGGSIDLQTSAGVTTRGNLNNRFLPEGGADISVLAGLGDAAPKYDEFAARYLTLGAGQETDPVAYVEAVTGEENLTREEALERLEQFAAYRADLVDFVEQRTGGSDLTDAVALERFNAFDAATKRRFLEQIMFDELRASGRDAAQTGSGDFSRGFTALETLFPGSNPDTGAGEVNPYAGDIRLYFSRLYTLGGGDISLFSPGGGVNVGLATPPDAFGIVKQPSELGIVAQQTGDINVLAYSNYEVNESRTFAADGGNIMVWSTDGDIDAGRGAKTAISAPPPTIIIDEQGRPTVQFPAALTGSGIQTLATTPGRKPGNVDLFAPRGVVNAGDAGIVAGNLTIAATAVLGADNIQVSGVAVGVPVDTGGLGAALAGVSNVASSASNAATSALETGEGREQSQASVADAALSWLEVFVVGLGEDTCKQDDVECLKRQK